MTEEQIQKYRDYPKGKKMHLYGYSSCSTSKTLAMSFASDDPENQKKAVLYHIVWEENANGSRCFIMDSSVSAYCEEQEILLYDGVEMSVESVAEENHNGKNIIVIHLRAASY